MSTLTSKFGLGDKVWRIDRTVESIKLPCRTCRGRGSLKALTATEDEKMLPCPDCGPRGARGSTATLGTWPVYRVDPQPLTIGMIKLSVYSDAVDSEDEESYMAFSTGIGSGSVHHVEDLFATPEEAQEEAEERTDKARRGEFPGGRKRDAREWWPTTQQTIVAAGFLDHRDVYEHDASHIALAEAIVSVAAERKPC